MKKAAIIFASAISAFAISAVQADCTVQWCSAKNLSASEKLICSDVGLKAADSLMDNIYKELMGYKGKPGYEGMWSGEVESGQQDWLKSRNQISVKTPMMDSYLQRIGELQDTLKSVTKQ